MAQRSPVRVLRPVPYFPVVRRKNRQYPRQAEHMRVDERGMLYFPGFAKSLDGFWLRRCVARWLDDLPAGLQDQTILDAHFGYPEGVGCVMEAKRRQIPVFVTIRGLEIDYFGTRIGEQIVDSLNAATGVIAVSESLRRHAVRHGVLADQIHVIPNGVDPAVFHFDDSSPCPTQNVKPLLVSVGNLKPVKGWEILFRAFQKIRQHADCHLAIIGAIENHRYFAQLRRLTETLNIEDDVMFLGALPPSAVACWLRRSDLFVLASHREGCCNAILESLACGCPVVATDVGDNGRFIRSGVSGQIVPRRAPDELCDAVLRILMARLDRNRIAATMAGLSWHQTARKVLTYFASRCRVDIADFG